MKIKDILEQDNWRQDSPGYKTKKTRVDPETGTISWDVQKTPINAIDKEMENLHTNLKYALKDYPNDEKLEKFYNVFTSFKKQLRTHLTRKYGR